MSSNNQNNNNNSNNNNMFPNDNPDVRRDFQKGLDPEESRRKRQDDRLNLRKKTREQRLNKRRKKNTNQSVLPQTNTISDNGNKSSAQQIPQWVKLENLSKFVEKINSNNFEEIFMGVQAIRQLLSVEDQPPIEQVFKAGIVPKLLSIMEKQIPHNKEGKASEREKRMIKLQFEAAWAVTNIASGDPKYTIHLVKMNAIRSFMKLLENTKDVETADQAIWGLGNIAGDCPRLRDEVLNTGVLDYILKNLFEFPLSMKRNAVWTVSNFCRGKPSPNWEKVKHILRPLSKLITQTKDYDIIVDILWAISFLSEDRSNTDNNNNNNNNNGYNNNSNNEEDLYGPSFQVNAVLETGVIKYVIHLIQHASKMGQDAYHKIQEERHRAHQNNSVPNIPPHIQQQLSTSDFVIAPCVRILGNIVSGTDEQTQKVVDDGFYDVIETCIEHRVRNIRKESCWALSNVVAGTQNQLDKFFEKPSLVKKVVSLALNGEINVRKEAGWCLSNAICGATFEQVEILVEARFLEAMVNLLSLHNVEKILRMAMEALDGCMQAYINNQQNINTNNYQSNNYNPFVEKVEELGGLDKLEEIQSLDNINDETYSQAAELVAKYWGQENNNNNNNNMNNVSNNTNNFDFGENNNNNSWDNNDDDIMNDDNNNNNNNNDNWMDDDNNNNNNNNNDFGFGDEGGFDDTQNVNDENVYEF